MGTPAAKQLPQTWTKVQFCIVQPLALKRKQIFVPSGVWAAHPALGLLFPAFFPRRVLSFPPPFWDLPLPFPFLPDPFPPFP